MEKQDFIFLLFDNGNGLTLDQIRKIEAYLPEMIDPEMITDIKNQMPDANAERVALDLCRDCFIGNLTDCGDLIELQDYLASEVGVEATDAQIFHLWHAIG